MFFKYLHQTVSLYFPLFTLPDEVITCTQDGYTSVNIDDYDGLVQISSPGFFDEGLCYANDLNCGWTIHTNDPEAIITIVDSYHEVSAISNLCFFYPALSSFQLEREYEYVSVHDGPTSESPELGVFKEEHGEWERVHSYGPEMAVQFRSDESVAFKGFVMLLGKV